MRKLILGLISVLLSAGPASAATVTINDALPFGPVFNRLMGPDRGDRTQNGYAVPYRSYAFNVDTTGQYTINLKSPFFVTQYVDTYLLLYKDNFVPTDGRAFFVAENDNYMNSGEALQSQITRILDAGSTYIAVATSYGNGSSGEFYLTVSGPGNIDIAPFAAGAPEPGTWVMMVIGFGAVGFTMRQRREKLKLRIA